MPAAHAAPSGALKNVIPAMKYRQQDPLPASNSPSVLFERLNGAGIRYGTFTSPRNISAALAGDRDLDILVARDDYRHFCAIASGCGAIRSVNHKSLVSPGREDWFAPDFHQARYLHLDVHIAVRLGGKFNKAYPYYSYSDIRDWHMKACGNCSIRTTSPEDQARITLSRIAFEATSLGFRPWQRLGGKWAQKIDYLLFASTTTGEKAISYQAAGSNLQCRIRKAGGETWVRRGDLANIRRLVRARCVAPPYSMLTDLVRNALRTCRYATSRAMNRVWPGSTVDRRRPASGGIIVAVVAPDGMGKTTQVKRMSKLFGWKFSCAALYLGSGDGEGWRIRRVIRAAYIQRRAKIKASLLSDRAEDKSRSFTRRAGSFLLALWGVLVALERYASIRKARRMADRGLIVFCDRWPQEIQPGIMDGPTQQRGNGSPTWLRKCELSLYHRMAQIQPDISVQLVGDYATSQARKPGELTREGFDKRTTLMKEIRDRFPETRVLDAGRDVDEVSRSLFALVWSAL
jgi:hypothetical protein